MASGSQADPAVLRPGAHPTNSRIPIPLAGDILAGMEVEAKVNVRIFDDVNHRDILFAPDDSLAAVTNTRPTEWWGGRFSIAAAGSLVLPIGTVGTVAGIYIRALDNFDLQLNGSTPALPVRKGLGLVAADPIKFYVDTTASVILVTNPSITVALVGYYAVWGDPV